MKANELMIGDWVYDKVLKSNARVEALQPLIIKCDIHTQKHICDEFEPVKLTPEILEKNRFVKNYNGYGYTYSYHRNYPHLSPFEIYECFDGWGANIIGYGIEISGSTEDIDSVHMLQHALHLCGLDELADNIKV